MDAIIRAISYLVFAVVTITMLIALAAAGASYLAMYTYAGISFLCILALIWLHECF